MNNSIEYQRIYRAKHRERLNAQSRKCMQIKRAREKAEKLYEQRTNPKPPQYIKKSMRFIKHLTN